MAADRDVDTTGRGSYVRISPIAVRQPRPYDIVDDPVRACGVGSGFEGQFTARVRDGHGAQIAEVPVHAGGTGVWATTMSRFPWGYRPLHRAHWRFSSIRKRETGRN
jgi:immunoglobulin-like protein involved in spore germination